jgi:hypothetical protein
MDIDEEELKEILRDAFDANFERLKTESGHAISQEVKETAWDQVICYWRKLRDIAEAVTDTEVRLNLPNQKTPDGRAYAIEGVVDIVREGDSVAMYDIKTHDAGHIREDIERYRGQLNVYAHIWKNLQGQSLDETAIIATQLPEGVKRGLRDRDPELLENTLKDWEPVVDIDFDPELVNETVTKFGSVVDDIESGVFAPKPVENLKERDYKGRPFASNVCRNCDARYSCASYREYARAPIRKDSIRFKEYFDNFDTDEERENWLDVSMLEK